MSDFIDKLLGRVGLTGSNAKALRFILGVGVVAYSVYAYTPTNQLLPVIGMLLGAYFIMTAIQ